MYNKVELPNGFVGLEKEITNLWTARRKRMLSKRILI